MELWRICEIKAKNKELLKLWSKIAKEIDEEEISQFFEEETETTKEQFEYEPIEHKIKPNYGQILRFYSKYKKALYSAYQTRLSKRTVLTKVKIREIEDLTIEYEWQNGELVERRIRTVKPIFRTVVVDNLAKFIKLLCKITTDAEEQYTLLYYYCWSKEMKKKASKPHWTIRDVQKRKEKEEKIKRIIELRKQGLSIRKIAEEVGLSKSTVQRILQKLNI